MSDAKVGKILNIAGKALLDVGGELGVPGLALQAVGAIARKVGKALEAGASVDAILKGMERIDDLVKPWRDPRDDGETTARESPSAKKKP